MKLNFKTYNQLTTFNFSFLRYFLNKLSFSLYTTTINNFFINLFLIKQVKKLNFFNLEFIDDVA